MASTAPRTRAEERRRLRRRGRVRAFTAALAALATVLGVAGGSLVLSAGAANASQGDPTGVSSTLLINGTPASGTPVVTSGDTETLQIQYSNQVAPGSVLKVKLGDNVTLGPLPATNTAIKSITQEGDGTVDITFADPWPGDVNQGVMSLAFRVNNVSTSGPGQIQWSVDGQANAQNVTILKPGDSPAPTSDSQAKSVSGTFNGLATVSGGVVSIPAGSQGKTVSYTLTAGSVAGNPAYAISDVLAKDLDYVPGSFQASLSTWDAGGWNKTTSTVPFAPTITGTPATGESFAATQDLPAHSVLTVTYKAQIPTDPTALADLTAQLQAAYDANPNLPSNGGSFSINLANTATIGGTPKTATTTMSGTVAGIPGPVPGNAFSKSASVSRQNVIPAADGTLSPAVPITYTLGVDLTQWNGSNPKLTLTQNVVVSDPLPTGATWNSAAGNFLTTSNGLTLTEAASCPTDGSFAGGAFVDQWCVSGQTLLINVGQDDTLKTSIQAQALVGSVAALPAGTTTVVGGKAYNVANTATFTYAPSTSYTRTATSTLVDRGTPGPNGYQDPSVFAKTTSPSQITVQPGQSTTVSYTFTVNAKNDGAVDASTAKIVDTVDPNVFDLSSTALAAIQSGITGTYGSTNLVASDFTVTLAGNDLGIVLSASGLAKATPADQNWTAVLPLTTKPVTGKQTIAITNSATIYGGTGTPLYNSTVSSQVSSYGDEAEVVKTVRDTANGDWTNNLRAQLDGQGNLVQDTYVYQVQFIPHGGYNNVTIVPVADDLPAGTQFLGFVPAADVDAPAGNTSNGPVAIGGGIQANYSGGTMSLTGNLNDPSGTPLTAYFAVRITSFTADVPIVNKIGSSAASITPSTGYPLAIAKQSSADQSIVITDHNARFQLTDADGDVVVDDIFVDNGFLRVAGPDGRPAAVKVDEPGTYTLSEMVPPAGYVKSDDTMQIVVTTGTLPAQQTFFDEPVGPSVSVGDHVWVDANHNGRQDAGEPGIPGVVLDITGPDGQPVTGVNGMPVSPVTTDANGTYLFTGLPVLQDGQSYTVSIDKGASQQALAAYTPTTPGVGDRAGDSSSWTASSEGLTQGGQSDLTLDFGFVQKTYAIGDKVWIDTNHNGVQDAGESPLAGVGVTLLDGSGAVVATTTTNAQGLYIFDDLPAGTYQVAFQLTPAQAAEYRFTTENSGTSANDSDANPGTGLTRTFTLGDGDTSLTTSYDAQTVNATQGIDPTWDAGVELIDAGASLATTGGVLAPLAMPAILLIGGGLLLFLLRRRRRA